MVSASSPAGPATAATQGICGFVPCCARKDDSSSSCPGLSWAGGSGYQCRGQGTPPPFSISRPKIPARVDDKHQVIVL